MIRSGVPEWTFGVGGWSSSSCFYSSGGHSMVVLWLPAGESSLSSSSVLGLCDLVNLLPVDSIISVSGAVAPTRGSASSSVGMPSRECVVSAAGVGASANCPVVASEVAPIVLALFSWETRPVPQPLP